MEHSETKLSGSTSPPTTAQMAHETLQTGTLSGNLRKQMKAIREHPFLPRRPARLAITPSGKGVKRTQWFAAVRRFCPKTGCEPNVAGRRTSIAAGHFFVHLQHWMNRGVLRLPHNTKGQTTTPSAKWSLTFLKETSTHSRLNQPARGSRPARRFGM